MSLHVSRCGTWALVQRRPHRRSAQLSLWRLGSVGPPARGPPSGSRGATWRAAVSFIGLRRASISGAAGEASGCAARSSPEASGAVSHHTSGTRKVDPGGCWRTSLDSHTTKKQ